MAIRLQKDAAIDTETESESEEDSLVGIEMCPDLMAIEDKLGGSSSGEEEGDYSEASADTELEDDEDSSIHDDVADNAKGNQVGPRREKIGAVMDLATVGMDEQDLSGAHHVNQPHATNTVRGLQMQRRGSKTWYAATISVDNLHITSRYGQDLPETLDFLVILLTARQQITSSETGSFAERVQKSLAITLLDNGITMERMGLAFRIKARMKYWIGSWLRDRLVVALLNALVIGQVAGGAADPF